jgi:HlyD family secretion protein
MRVPRVRFTTRRLMVVVFAASLIFAAISLFGEHQRRILALRELAASYQNAVLTREVAEIAVVEYVEGVFKQEEASAQSEITLAQSDRKRAEERLVWANRLYGGRLTLQRTISIEHACTKLKVLEKYTKDKTIRELKSEVEKARADEQAKKAAYDRMKWAVFLPF